MADSQRAVSPFLMLLPTASTSSLDSQPDSYECISPDNQSTITSSILTAAVPGRVFPRLTGAPIPTFMRNRPGQLHEQQALGPLTTSDTDSMHDRDSIQMESVDGLKLDDELSTSVAASSHISQRMPSRTLWDTWQRQRPGNSDGRHSIPLRHATRSGQRHGEDSDSVVSIETSSSSVSSILSQTAAAVVDYSARGWLVWTARIGIIYLFVPFLNGVMLGFGEICANELTIRTGWFGLRALTESYMLRP